MEPASDTNIVTEEDLLQKPIGENIVKTKMINVAGQMFIQYEKHFD